MTGPALAIDIGGTNTKAGLVDAAGAVHGIVVLPTTGPDPARFLDRVLGAIDPLLLRPCSGVGISVAGFLDENRAHLLFNPNLEWLQGYPLRETLERRFPAPVALEVDSNAAALAEARFGEGIGSKRFLCVTVGTGIGAGMISNGELLRVAHGCIGDAGHVIVRPDGRACSCGGRGCAEAEAAAPYIVNRYRECGGAMRTDSAAVVIAAASAGDPEATATLAEAGHNLGVALASLANIFFPDTIAVGGGVSEAGDLLLSPAIAAFRRSAGPFAGSARVVRATLGWQAPLVGAALSALGASEGNRN